jgi:cytidyltransferase-like protein
MTIDDAKQKAEQELILGLLAWYPIPEKSHMLFLGEDMDALAEYYRTRGCTVEIEFGMENADGRKYDVILLHMEAKSKQECILQIEICKSHLAPGGHLFIAMENRYGLRYFCGDQDPYTNRIFDGIEDYQRLLEQDLSQLSGRLWSKAEMEECIVTAGFFHYKCYSILPGLEMPQQIYAEDYLPQEEMDKRYTPYYHHPKTVFLQENMLYGGIIQNGMFHMMANAYLMDCTIDGDLGNVCSVTTALDRGVRLATATILKEDNTVEKKALFPEGKENICHLVENTARLQEQGISVVPVEANATGDGVIMPYIHEELAQTYLRRLFMEDLDVFFVEMDRFVAQIKASSYEVPGDNPELVPYYRRVYIDLQPNNCFHTKEGKYLFFDQEFCEENFPLGVPIVRAVDYIYDTDRKMEERYPEKKMWARYGVLDKVGQYRQMETNFVDGLRRMDNLQEFNRRHMVDGRTLSSNALRMNYSNEEYQKLFQHPLDNVDGKDIYLFGAGKWTQLFLANFGDRCQVTAILDNKVPEKEEVHRNLGGLPICNPMELCSHLTSSYKVIVCVKNCGAILRQLKELGVTNYSLYDPYREWGDRSDWRKKQEEWIQTEQQEKNASAEGGQKYVVGYVAGVFDLFHVGHLNLLRRAKEQCEYLLVGVVSDEQASQGKAHSPYVNQQERLEIVQACRYVDEAFVLPVVASGTQDVYRKYHFDVQFSGSDYEHDPFWLQMQTWLRERGSDLVFFPYTQTTSSTKLKAAIEKEGN